MTTGEWMIAHLRANEKTMYWLSKDSGISYTMIMRYKNNEYEPKREQLKKIILSLAKASNTSDITMLVDWWSRCA